MDQWSNAAKAKLESYFERVRKNLESSEADVNEVIDLRRHVEQEAAALNLPAVTEQDIEHILTKIDPVGYSRTGSKSKPTAAETKISIETTKKPSWFLLLFGVLLPLFTIGFEYFTGGCAGLLFDPIPTLPHLLLVLSAPAAIFSIWLLLRRGDLRWRRQLGWVAGFAMGISSIYALLFLPLIPFAFIGIIFYGIGFLPLAPLATFISAACLCDWLKRTANEARLPGVLRGFGLGIGLLTAFTLPMILTQVGLGLTSSNAPADVSRGVRLLRTWGLREQLLRACYGRRSRDFDLYSWGQHVDPEKVREVYYRVTGQPFNSVPPPKLYAGRGRWNLVEEEFTWDEDQAGEAVAGRVKGLSLKSSRQDGFIESDAALAYLQWTMEFQNDSVLQREARAQILLPHDSVVSRLTLWIDGEEREAAFGGRSRVKTAYKEVVSRRRDPVLITTCGPDRVLLQCFPIPPRGGTMKVRIGITAPLWLTNLETGFLRCPCLAERNFTIPDGFRHSLWVESKEALSCGKLKHESSKPGTQTVRGEISEAELAAPSSVLRAARRTNVREVFTEDTHGAKGFCVRQTFAQRSNRTPDRIIFVVDGSEGMRDGCASLSKILEGVPTGTEIGILLAQDGVKTLLQPRKLDPAVLKEAASSLRRVHGTGGQDNIAALVQAWDLAADKPAGSIVWIHGPQPVLLASGEDLQQRFERRPDGPRVFEIQTQVGPNRIVERLDGIEAVRPVARLGDIETDLRRLFEEWKGAGLIEVVRERIRNDDTGAKDRGRASLHLARLWGAEEVARLTHTRQTDEAMRLAQAYQLVTPVSGAVVLESREQYSRAGLQPSPADTVPVIPEPSVPALVIVGFVVWLLIRKPAHIVPKARRVDR